jgi:outer membrane protein assembly factor BamE (lipoprotein component of BamABCDE complex)
MHRHGAATRSATREAAKLRMRPEYAGLALVILANLIAGCVLTQTTDGTPLEPDAVKEIVIGESTRADVTRLLGTPDEIVYSN